MIVKSAGIMQVSDSDKPEKKSNAAKSILLTFLPAICFGFVGYFFGKQAFKALWLRDIFDSISGLDLLVLPIVILFVLAIHELGHLLGGFSRGMKFLLFVVGPFQFMQSQAGIRFKWTFNLGTFGGLAAATPDTAQALAPQMKRLIAGGPLASLLLTMICLWIFTVSDGRMAAYAFMTGGFSLLIFIVTALPFRAGGFMSDGMQFIEIMRGGQAVEERQTLLTLMGQSMAGVRPRELDRELIIRALDFHGDPLRQVVAHMYAYNAALDSGNENEIGQQYQWLAGHAEQLPVGFRQSLALELAMHEAMNGNLESARDWMKKSKGGITDGARRALAEAHLALAEKDNEAAQILLVKARKLMSRGYDAGSNLLTIDQIAAAEKALQS